ncbi:MAG: hypothetical protein QW607_12175 [Desulfurococcaceae archaeon]
MGGENVMSGGDGSVLRYNIPGYISIYRLFHWLKDNGYRGVVVGMPGSFKTTRMCYLPLFVNTVVVMSFPLRKLRDEVYERIKNDPRFKSIRNIVTVFKGHDEICQPLMNRIQNNPGVNYLKVLSDHVSGVEKGKEGCVWKYEIDRMIDILKKGEPKLILTTHRLSLILKIIDKYLRRKKKRDVPTIFIFDEGEDLFLRVGEPLDFKVLLDLKVHKKIYRKFRSMYRPLYKGMRVGYLPITLIHDVFFNSVMVSASFPPTLMNVLCIDMWGRGGDCPEYRMRVPRVPDKIIIYNKILRWDDEDKWRKSVYPILLSIVNKVVDKGYPVGIVSRNLIQSKSLTELLEGMGFIVYSDHRDNNPKPFYQADAVIVTVLGKGYRGINLYTRKNSSRWDFPVVVGFYQGRGLGRKHIHPFFYEILRDEGRVGDEIDTFVKEMIMGKNFQTLFRFVRDKTKEHILILMDRRWDETIKTYGNYYYLQSRPLIVDNVEDIITKSFPFIDSLP